MPNTTFTPVTHGLKFSNTFANHRFAFGGIHLNFGGRCAGMVYTALDYFYIEDEAVPPNTTLPVEGSALSTYISVRQDAATWGTIDRWLELVLGQPARSAEFYGWGLQEHAAAGQIKREIDAGRPAPIGLVSAVDLFQRHHQPLAIGYDGSGESLRIEVYDPNFPNVTKILRPYPDRQTWGYEDEGADRSVWRTYFFDPNYRHRVPAIRYMLAGADRRGANYRGHNLHRQVFGGVNATGADFTGATATYTDFELASLELAKFRGANVSHASFRAASLLRADFHGADLKVATLAEAQAQSATFYGADLKLVNEKVEDAAMGMMNLEKATFYGADLHRAKLMNARATDADFRGANLSHADLRKVDFTGANLEGADLRNADLREAVFTDTNLRGADMAGAKLDRAIDVPARI